MLCLNIKFPMHLTVKLSENNFHLHNSSCKLGNMLKNVLAISFVNVCQLNPLNNEVIKMKMFFYNVLLTQLPFAVNIGN